jgi:hypothetical protein
MRYRKKPVVIDAFQWWPGVAPPDWMRSRDDWVVSQGTSVMTIYTLEGTMSARPGDWIIRGVQNEIYPCRNDIFEATYEPVRECCVPEPEQPDLSKEEA